LSEDRYSRQTLFAPIGKVGQERLRQAHVLVIGAGALGTNTTELLVRAGIGKLTIIDRDYVEWSNLQRQQLYTEEDATIRLPKAVAAENRLKQLNSACDIQGIVADVGPVELEAYRHQVDLIIDATDNFETRMLINDVSQKYKIPWIYGGCTGSYGVSFTVIPEHTPCLSCLLGTLPMTGETCDTVGVISPAVQIVTAHQVAEAMKILVGDYEALRGTLLYFDIWKNEQASINVSAMKKDDCPSCGHTPTYPFLNGEHQTRSAVLCGRESVQIRPAESVERDLTTLAHQLKRVSDKVDANPYLINVVVDGYRMVIFKDGRALIHGTKDLVLAKSLYNRYVGG
jgi:sulfur carrier protein ThiS adenylyltransferase